MKILKHVYDKTNRGIIDVHEEFMPYQTKTLDSKNRITLGCRLKKIISKRIKVETYQIFVGKNGDILLRPAVSIPITEAWIYKHPKVISSIHKGLKEAKEGKTERVDDLDSFLNNL